MSETAVVEAAPAAQAQETEPQVNATSPETKAMLQDAAEFMGAGPMIDRAGAEKRMGAKSAEAKPAVEGEKPQVEDEKPTAPAFELPNWFNKDEKALYAPLAPEKLAELKPFLEPYMRQDKEREKGVQKYIQQLGPMAEIAKDKNSVQFTRLVYETPELLQATQQLALNYLDAQAKGAKFDPSAAFGKAQPHQQATAPNSEWEGHISRLAAMSPEEREVEIANSPGKLFDGLQGVLAKLGALETSMGQKLAPVEQMREQQAYEARASQELDAWKASLPQDVQDMPEAQFLELTNEVADMVAQNRDAWLSIGHTPITMIDKAFTHIYGQRGTAKAQAAAKGAEASKEAALRQTRADSPAGGVPPESGSAGRGAALAAELRKASFL